MQLKIALAQIRIVPNEPLKNLATMDEWVARAAEQGAGLVVFPEDAVCGPLTGQTSFVPYAGDYLQHMCALALKHKVDLVPGSWTVPVGGLLYNVAYYITAEGLVAGSYSKINLWETEKLTISPGVEPMVFATRYGPVGLAICWDLSFPEVFLALRAKGAKLVIMPTYWSFPEGTLGKRTKVDEEIDLIDSLCLTRAFENDCVLAYCNAAGVLKQGDAISVLSGRSQVCHPLQKRIAMCDGNAEELLFALVELP